MKNLIVVLTTIFSINAFAQSNTLYIEQSGAGFTGAITQDGATNRIGTVSTPSIINGTTNTLTINQVGNTNSLDFAIYGDTNTISITNTGDTNSVTLDIGSNGADSSTNSYTLDITGSSNTIESTITGGINTVDITIFGDGNTITNTISSSNTELTLSITGSTNTITTTQSGAGAHKITHSHTRRTGIVTGKQIGRAHV